MSNQDHKLFHLLDQLTPVSHGCRITTLRKGSKCKSQSQFALLMGLVEFKDSSLCGTDDKGSACNAGDRGSIPGSGRFPWEGNSYPRQYSCLENSMNRVAFKATVHGVAKRWTTEWLTHTSIWKSDSPQSTIFVQSHIYCFQLYSAMSFYVHLIALPCGILFHNLVHMGMTSPTDIILSSLSYFSTWFPCFHLCLPEV